MKAVAFQLDLPLHRHCLLARPTTTIKPFQGVRGSFNNVARYHFGRQWRSGSICCTQQDSGPSSEPSSYKVSPLILDGSREVVHNACYALESHVDAAILQNLFKIPADVQAHINWKSIRDDIELHRRNVVNRNSNAKPDRVVQLYDEWRDLQTQAESLRTERNANARAMKVSFSRSFNSRPPCFGF